MSPRFPVRGAALALALAAAACTDAPTEPGGETPGGPGAPGGPGGPAVLLQAVECTAQVAARTVSCGEQGADNADLVFGGQNTHVRISASEAEYDAAAGRFSFAVVVRSLIPQPVGTADTLAATPDPAGIRVFFAEAPAATAGTGAIAVTGDGTAAFGGLPAAAFYRYDAVLRSGQQTGPRRWTLNVPSTVQAFRFRLLVAAAVPWPNGYVELQGDTLVRSGTARAFVAVPRSALGVRDTGAVAVVFSVSDTTVAAPRGAPGTVHALRSGVATLRAVAADGRTGRVVLRVAPRRRVWTGAAGSTAWQAGGNWWPDNVAPTPQDTAVLSDTVAAPGYPALQANTAVGGLEVLRGTLSLGAFELAATGDVATAGAGRVTATTGGVVLAGRGRAVRGALPRTTLTGTYTLSGDLTVAQQFLILGGELASTSFELRQDP